ncbi:MAG: regulatory protein RecX [Solirubrobacterales bacterium]
MGGARESAFERGLAALRRKERTAAELTVWLAEREFPADEIETALALLTELGELGDERFARRYAEDKRELSGWGAERIRVALLARGVDHDAIEAALAGDSASDQIDRAADLLARRGDQLADEPARGRALAYLTRRGYDYEIAYEAVRRTERRAA